MLPSSPCRFLGVILVIVAAALAATGRSVVTSAASPGAIDQTFNPGAGISPISKPIPVRVIFPLSDGSFLLGGIFTNYNGVQRTGLAKILEDGGLDKTFVPDPTFNAPNTEVWGISQQPDGKFIIAGMSGANIRAKIVRLNADGSVDPSFSFSTPLSAFAMAVEVRADSLISYLADGQFGLSLLNPNGAPLLASGGLDRAFGLFNRIRTSPDGHAFYTLHGGLYRYGGSFGLPDDVLFTGGGAVHDLDFQSDGRIVVAGPSGMRRYSKTGVIDPAFQPKFSSSGLQLYALVAQSDDKLLVGGTFTSVNSIGRRNFARLNADGTLDTNFDTGAGPNAVVYAIAPVANGKALIAGSFTSYDGISRTGIARIFLNPPAAPLFVAQPQSTNLTESNSLRLHAALTATSPVSYRWRKDGQPLDAATNAVLFIRHSRQNDAGLYTLEVTTPFGFITSDVATVTVASAPSGPGSLDMDFAAGEGASRSIAAYLKLVDGKSLLGGNFFAFDGHLQPALVRLHSNGSLDTSLNFNLPPNTVCNVIARSAGGKILAGFNSIRAAVTNSPVLMRLNADGSADASFFPNAIADILAILPLPEGKLLIGGSFGALDGIARRRLARLNPDCSIDLSFDANAIQFTKVYALALLPEGKIIVADDNRLVRLTPDGALDSTVALNSGFAQNVRTLVIQPDGGILAGGRFTSVAGAARTNLARLNADLTVDDTFISAAGAVASAASSVQSLVLQLDGKIFVAGFFQDLAGASSTNIARLHPNGTIDLTFAADVNFPTPSTRSGVNSIDLDIDGSLTFGGLFSRVNGFTRNSLARIALTPPLRLIAEPDLTTQPSVTLRFTLDPSFDYILQYTETLPAAWLDLMTIPPGSTSIAQPLSSSQRFFRIVQIVR